MYIPSILCSFGEVAVLQTLDGNGTIRNYVGGVATNQYPHFFGPGLYIYVYIQCHA